MIKSMVIVLPLLPPARYLEASLRAVCCALSMTVFGIGLSKISMMAAWIIAEDLDTERVVFDNYPNMSGALITTNRAPIASRTNWQICRPHRIIG